MAGRICYADLVSILLAIIPRAEHVDTEALVDESLLITKITSSLGPKYSSEPQVLHHATSDGGMVIAWNVGTEQRNPNVKSGVWTACSTQGFSRKIREGVRTRNGRLSVDPTIGGSYMALWGNKGSRRIFAWSTPPAIEPVYYATDDDNVYISNRPLPIAFALTRGKPDTLAINEDYIREYLNYGFSISSASPFKGISVLMPRTCLSVWRGNIQILDEPDFGEIDLQPCADSRETGSAELASALKRATWRLIEQQPQSGVQLRLSGGKDSRLMLGLLNLVPDCNVTAVTQGDSASAQVKVAAELADLAGIDFIATAPNMTVESSIIQSCETTIFQSSGLIPSEPTIAPFSAPDPLEPGEFLAAGEWPLFKGYLERTSNRSMEAVEGQFSGSSKNLLDREGNHRTDSALDRWKASLPVFSSYEMLYFYGRDIRAARYQHAKTAQIDSQSTVFYPFLDTEVVNISDSLPVVNRRNHYSMFTALRDIWPESFSVPFAANEGFRFERFSSTKDFSVGFQGGNQRAPREYQGEIKQYSQRPHAIDSEFYHSPISASANFVVTSGEWDYLRRFIDPNFAERIQGWARKTSDSELEGAGKSRKEQKETKIKVWRILMIVLWLKRRWLKATW